MVTDPLEPLTHVPNWSRNLETSLIVNLRLGLPYTTEVFMRGSSGFKEVGKVCCLRSKHCQK